MIRDLLTVCTLRHAGEDIEQGRDLGAIDAIRNNNMHALTEAVEAGADVNFFDHFGQTVLVWAAYTGSQDMAEYLIWSLRFAFRV
jgi:ankyrin repeat protein